MASREATSTGSQVPKSQNSYLDEIRKQLETKYRLSTIHRGEEVYLVKQETGDGLCIYFSNETSINLDRDTFSQDLTVHIKRSFANMPAPRILKIRAKSSTSPNTSQNEATQESVSLIEFRDYMKKNEEYQRILLKEVKAVGDIVKQSIENSSNKIVNSLDMNMRKLVQQLQMNNASQSVSTQLQQQSRVRSTAPLQRLPQQNENQPIPPLLTTRGFGGNARQEPADKSTCKPALLADILLRERIAEQREEWERRQAQNQESGLDTDDWETPINQHQRDQQRNLNLPSRQDFRQSSQRAYSPPDLPKLPQRPGGPLGERQELYISTLFDEVTSRCYHCKSFDHPTDACQSEAARRETSKRRAEVDDFASSKQKYSRNYGPGPPNVSRGYTYEQPEVYTDTDRYNPDQRAEHQQRYDYPTGQFGQQYSDVWNR